MRLSLGRLTVILAPFAAPHLDAAAQRESADEEDDDAPARGNIQALRATLASRVHPCLPFQKNAVLERRGDAGCEHGWYIVAECAHPAVAAARRAVAASAPAQWLRLIGHLRQLHAALLDGAPPPYAPVADWLEGQLSRPAGEIDMSSPEGRWLLFRTLAMVPWSAAAAAPENYVVAAFGDVFDGAVLPAPHLRRFATRWASWSVGPLLSVYAPVRVTRRHHLP